MSEERLHTEIGYCRFCNHGRMVEITEDLEQEELNRIATEECSCYGATKERELLQQKEVCEANIQEMLGEKHPGVAQIFLDSIELIQSGKIKKITVNIPGNRTARIYTNKDGIQVDLEIKSKAESLA